MKKKFILLFFCLFSLFLSAKEITLLISQLGSSNKNGIVEIYNYGEQRISLSNLRLEVDKNTTATDNPDIFCLFKEKEGIIVTDFSIAPKGYFLITHLSLAALVPQADFYITNTTGLRGYFDTNDSLFLGTGAINNRLDPDIIDLIGCGDAQTYLVQSAPELRDGYFLERKSQYNSTVETMKENGKHHTNGNSYNSRNNSQDFVLTPFAKWQSSTSPLEFPTILNDTFKIALAQTYNRENLYSSFELIPLGRLTVYLPFYNDRIDDLALEIKGMGNLVEFSNKIYIGVDYQKNKKVFSLANTNGLILLKLKNQISSNHLTLSTSHLNTHHPDRYPTNDIEPSYLNFYLKNPRKLKSFIFDITSHPSNFHSRGRHAEGPTTTMRNLFYSPTPLFSEIQVNGRSSRDEFVELYNPYDTPLSLQGYDLYYQSFLGNYRKIKTFSNITIAAQSYYLIGGSDFTGDADETVELALNSISSGFNLSLFYSNQTILDQVILSNMNARAENDFFHAKAYKSYERKAFSHSTTEAMERGVHEFSGNRHHHLGSNYPRDWDRNTIKNFITRNYVSPQSSTNWPEPSTPPSLAITNYYPVVEGQILTIKGENLGRHYSNFSQLSMAGSNLKIVSWHPQKIRVIIPALNKMSNQVLLRQIDAELNQINLTLRPIVLQNPILRQLKDLSEQIIRYGHSLSPGEGIKLLGESLPLSSQANTKVYLRGAHDFRTWENFSNEISKTWSVNHHLLQLMTSENLSNNLAQKQSDLIEWGSNQISFYLPFFISNHQNIEIILSNQYTHQNNRLALSIGASKEYLHPNTTTLNRTRINRHGQLTLSAYFRNLSNRNEWKIKVLPANLKLPGVKTANLSNRVQEWRFNIPARLIHQNQLIIDSQLSLRRILYYPLEIDLQAPSLPSRLRLTTKDKNLILKWIPIKFLRSENQDFSHLTITEDNQLFEEIQINDINKSEELLTPIQPFTEYKVSVVASDQLGNTSEKKSLKYHSAEPDFEVQKENKWNYLNMRKPTVIRLNEFISSENKKIYFYTTEGLEIPIPHFDDFIHSDDLLKSLPQNISSAILIIEDLENGKQVRFFCQGK